MFKHQIADIRHLLDDIPAADQPEDEALFWKTVAGELSMLIQYCDSAQQPQLVFSPVRKTGSQYIWEFFVNELAKVPSQAINWHGQNISQWVYAGAILLHDKKVSAHH